MADDYKLQISFKYGKDDMINLRGNTVEEVEGNLTTLTDRLPLMLAMVETIQIAGAEAQVRNAFPGAERIEDTPKAAPSGQKLCQHGVPYEVKAGKRKDGSSYSGLVCTVKNDPRLNECPPIWRN